MKRKIISLLQTVLVLVVAYSLFKTYVYYRDNQAYNALEQDYKNQLLAYAPNIQEADEYKPGLDRGQNNDALIASEEEIQASEDEEIQASEEKEIQKPEEEIHIPEDKEIQTSADKEIQASLEFINNLKQSYPQVQARLIIDSLDMDYPIVQGQDNTYYLNHNYKGEYHPFGAVFIDSRNTPDFDNQNTIVYGHNVKTGHVFHSLKEYRDEDFVRDNPYIIVDTTSQRLTYKIFAVYVADAYDDYRSIAYKDQEFDDFLMLIKDKNLFKGQSPSPNDKILTLSTCTNMEDVDDRLVVQAVLVK